MSESTFTCIKVLLSKSDKCFKEEILIMKRMMKSALVLALVAGTTALTSCGAKPAAKLVASYDIVTYSEIAVMGWNIVNTTQLKTYDNNTYQLIQSQDIFGAIEGGFETKGHRVIVTVGNYTSVTSADGLDGHVDFSLSASPWVYIYQHDKAYGRNTDIIGSNTIIDTTAWTDKMTEATIGTYANGAADILATYGAAKKVTVEDPTLDPDGELLLRPAMIAEPEKDENGAAAPSASNFKKIKAAYDISKYDEIAALGWKSLYNYSTILYEDGSYDYTEFTNRFGAIDGGFEAKAIRFVLTSGSYSTTNTASDEVDGHGTLTLGASDRVYLAQHEKAWTRSTDVVGTPLIADTDNWTEKDTEAISGEGSFGTMEAFKAHFGSEKTAIYEDLSLFPEDESLTHRLVTVPTSTSEN